MPTLTASTTEIDASPGLGNLAVAISRYLYGPRLEALLGVRQLLPARDGVPPAETACGHCGAVRDAYGVVLWTRVVCPGVLGPDGEPFRVTRPTGIQPGHALTCPACDAMNPALEVRSRKHARPARPAATSAEDAPRPLTARERKTVARTAQGRCWLAMLDAETAGDSERAGRLQSALYGHQDGLLGDEDLERLTVSLLSPPYACP